MSTRNVGIGVGLVIWVMPIGYDISIWPHDRGLAAASLEQIAIFTALAGLAAIVRAKWNSVRLFKKTVGWAASSFFNYINVFLAVRCFIGLHSGLYWWSVLSSWGLWLAYGATFGTAEPSSAIKRTQ